MRPFKKSIFDFGSSGNAPEILNMAPDPMAGQGCTHLRIAFFLFETRDFNTYPTLTNAIRMMTEQGWQVDVYLPAGMATAWTLPGATLKVISNQHPCDYRQACRMELRRQNIRYDLAVASFLDGLVPALVYIKEIPVIYISLELFYHQFPGIEYRRLLGFRNLIYLVLLPVAMLSGWLMQILPGRQTMLRRLAHSSGVRNVRLHLSNIYHWHNISRDVDGRIVSSIVQDEGRASVLRKEFEFVNDIMLVPNAYPGIFPEKSTFAVDRFGLHAADSILLYSGPASGLSNLDCNQLTQDLPENWKLFLQLYGSPADIKCLQNVLAALLAAGRVILHTENLSDGDYQQLVQSAHIGLAWYPEPLPDNLNMYYLGLSSGKMNRYLSCGLPVIVPGYFYGYPEIFKKHSIGLALSAATEIAGAVLRIDAEYETFQQAALKFYADQLEFRTRFEPVIEKMRSLHT